MFKLEYQIIHAFATSPKDGNPAAVVLLPPADNVPSNADSQSLKALYPPDDVLQATATKANQPMTAFALPLSSDSSTTKQSFVLRWFNPATEAWLCGHATMATSALLFSQNSSWEEVEYTTMKYGQIVAKRGLERGEVSMDFPELTELDQLEPSESEKYLKAIDGAAKGWDQSAVLQVWDSPDRLLIELDGQYDLAGLKVDCKKLAHISPKTLVLTQVIAKQQDVKEQIRSRVLVIVPGYEHEDQVTGSAHCLIIPYFLTGSAANTRLKTAAPLGEDSEGNTVMSCRQVSPSGGTLSVTWRKSEGKVRITGRCIGM